MDRTERKRKRALIMQRKGRRPGRVPFREDKKRFEQAMIMTWIELGKLEPRRATDFTVILLETKLPLEWRATENGYCILTSTYHGLPSRTEYLVNSMLDAYAAAVQNKEDMYWLSQSAMMLWMIFNNQARQFAYDRLLAIDPGWKPIIDALLKRFAALPETPGQARNTEIDRFRDLKDQPLHS